MINEIISQGYTSRFLGAYNDFETLSASVAPFEMSSAVGSKYFMQLNLSRALTAEELSAIETDMANAGIAKWTSSYIDVSDADDKVIYIAWEKGGYTTTSYGQVSTLAILNIILIILIPILIGGIVWLILPDSVKQIINMMITMGIMVVMMKVMGGMFGDNDKPKEVKTGKTKTQKAIGVAKAIITPGTAAQKGFRVAEELIDPESKKAKAIRIAQVVREPGTRRERALRAIDELAGYSDYDDERVITRQQVI